MKKTIEDFKNFITTGNLIAIAVGILMGAEIGNVVKSFTENLFTPIFAIFGGKPSFNDSLIVTINGADFKFGAFLTALIGFIAVALVAFFIVKVSNKIFPPKDTSGPTEVELLAEIRDALKK